MRMVVTLMSLLGLSVLTGEAGVRYVNVPEGSEVKVEGDSTLHGWDAKSREFMIALVMADALFEVDWEAGKTFHADLEFDLPAETLKSGKRGLDRQMHSALKVDDHPVITFRLLEATVKDMAADETLNLVLKGEVTCAGVTRMYEFEVNAAREDEDRIVLSGVQEMRMTDFEIDPPRAMLGAVRAADEVEVSFTFLLERDKGGGR